MDNLSTPPSVHRTRRVLVLGATSLIGRFLAPRLTTVGIKAVALTRSPAREPLEAVEWAVGDLTGMRSPALAAQLGTVEAILSLSPIWLLPAALPALLETGARRLVAFSSTSRLTKIASPVAAEREVAERLAQGEAETQRLCDEAGVAWTLFRPTLIYAEGQDRNISRLAGLIRRVGVLPLAGAGDGLRQPVHADDLAAAAVAVLDYSPTFGRSYNLPGGETLSYRTMVERVFEGLGRTPRIFSVPPWTWRLGLRLASPLLPGATTAMGSRMSADLVFDPEDAQRDFGWAPRPFRPRFHRLNL